MQKQRTTSQAERTWCRLWTILEDPTGLRRVYVYRLDSTGKPVGSFIWSGATASWLPELLRDEFNGGDFRVLIRQGRRMAFATNISILAPGFPHVR